jgi:hypothetical protein
MLAQVALMFVDVHIVKEYKTVYIMVYCMVHIAVYTTGLLFVMRSPVTVSHSGQQRYDGIDIFLGDVIN